ncbi:Casein kinase I isoform alpha [Mycena kentingensis (nom. inval.)]|nr:Casein kinase I isoform alpha [Mycena kentingensis (nom. inval.)]
MLQLLQGHRAIPEIFGYHRGPHFEFIGMELLGCTLMSMVTVGGLIPETVLRVGVQLLSALEHLQTKGVVHRDIKPSNILLSAKDPSSVILVDFNLSVLTQVDLPRSHHARPIVGTLDWCSLHVHEGRWPLQASDDLESLAYTLWFCLGGRIPWSGGYNKSARNPVALAYVANGKRAFTGAAFASVDYPLAAELGKLLDHARELPVKCEPCYPALAEQLSAGLPDCDCCTSNAAALDFTRVPLLPPALKQVFTHIRFPYKEYDAQPELVSDRSDSDDLTDSNSICMEYPWYTNLGRAPDPTFPAADAEFHDHEISSSPFCLVSTYALNIVIALLYSAYI